MTFAATRSMIEWWTTGLPAKQIPVSGLGRFDPSIIGLTQPEDVNLSRPVRDRMGSVAEVLAQRL